MKRLLIVALCATSFVALQAKRPLLGYTNNTVQTVNGKCPEGYYGIYSGPERVNPYQEPSFCVKNGYEYTGPIGL